MKKKKSRKVVKIILLIIIALVLLIAVRAFVMFRTEISIIRSIKRCEDNGHIYYTMEFKDGYHLDEMLEKNCSTDDEMATHLEEMISHGRFRSAITPDVHAGCSSLVVQDEEGHKLWGRNFDWWHSVPIIVKATPKDGYASVSTCEFTNITGDENIRPEGTADKFKAIAAYYVPMDGTNEMGLSVSELEVNEGGQQLVDTGKPKITTTMAIRLLLDRAATVDEAIDLLNQYDICPTGGISSHLVINDRSGKTVVAEFMNGKVEIVPTNVVTNFNLKNGDITAGGESAQKRYEILTAAYQDANGVMSASQLKDAMEKAAQKTGEWCTKWTLIYEDKGADAESIDVAYYWDADYENKTAFSMELK